MSQLIYANVDLSETKTMTYSVEPVMDRAGVGLLWSKLTISVVSVVHSLWCASGKPPGGLNFGGNMGVPGDRMGLSLSRLPEILRQPRQTLLFRVGQDLVVESPPRLPDGTQLPCDCANGPVTRGVRVLQVIGDESAIVSFTVETYLSSSATFCVSNRWDTHLAVDDLGYATRTISGRAVFRADFMNLYGLTADHFRPYLFVPADAPLRRVGVDARVSEDGNTIDYAVVDREVDFGTGANSDVMRIEGTVTSGGHIDLPSMKEVVKRAPSLSGEAGGAIFTAGASLFRNVPEALNTVIPEGRCSAMIRVFGWRGAGRAGLATAALDYGLAKVAPVWGVGRAILVGAHVTQTVGSEDGGPMVELRLEFWASHLLVAFLFDPSTVNQMMDWSVGAPEMVWRPGTARAPIGRTSNNSRGSYVREVVIQALGGPGELPGVPGAPGDAADVGDLA